MALRQHLSFSVTPDHGTIFKGSPLCADRRSTNIVFCLEVDLSRSIVSVFVELFSILASVHFAMLDTLGRTKGNVIRFLALCKSDIHRLDGNASKEDDGSICGAL